MKETVTNGTPNRARRVAATVLASTLGLTGVGMVGAGLKILTNPDEKSPATTTTTTTEGVGIGTAAIQVREKDGSAGAVTVRSGDLKPEELKGPDYDISLPPVSIVNAEEVVRGSDQQIRGH